MGTCMYGNYLGRRQREPVFELVGLPPYSHSQAKSIVRSYTYYLMIWYLLPIKFYLPLLFRYILMKMSMSRPRTKDEQWLRHKTDIRRLYLVEGMELNSLVEHLGRQDFHVTYVL